MSSVLLGLLGAVLIGGSDVLARVTSTKVSLSILLMVLSALSLAALTVYTSISGQWPVWHAWAWIASFISGLLNLVALGFLYRALARGPVTVASPAASSSTIVLVLINVLAGEPFVWLQGVAVLIVFFGIAMLSRRQHRGNVDAAYDAQWLRTTALFGLAAAVSIAVRMFLAQEAASVLEPVPALTLNRYFASFGVVVWFAWQTLRDERLAWPRGRIIGLVLLQAVLETCALLAFLIGSSEQGRVGATIGFAAFAAVSAIIARVWLGDPIGWRRAGWMAVVAGGIVLAAVNS